MFWQAPWSPISLAKFWQIPPAAKVLRQSIAISGNDRQSLPAQFFFTATMPLPCSDIMEKILFHKG